MASFASTATPSESALQIMRLSLFDWAAVAIAGREEPVARILRDVEGSSGGPADASVVGVTGKQPAKIAALINGATSHSLDYDDTHFDHIGHPSVAVIPAALALAEKTQATGPDLLEAALIGAEASVAAGVWLGRSHYQAGFHQTATAGAFGATIAAAKLLYLNAKQIEHALALVSTRASGLKAQFGTMGKPLNAGIASSNGVEAALLAAAGMTSDPAALDGSQGFAETHAGMADTTAFDGLGDDWRMERVSYKFHACCHGLHAMLEAVRDVQVDPSAIRKVVIHTHPRWLTVCNQPAPQTGLEAKFSFRFVVALALYDHDTGALETYSDHICRDPDLVRLRDKVTVQEDASLTEVQARVELTFDNESSVLNGDLDQNLMIAEKKDRLRHKAQSLFGPDLAEHLHRTIEAGDVDGLAAVLRGA
nr:MmgE/PrpD family protein [Actibacterium sp. 188UL27-1]